MADATAGASSVPTSSALHAASRHKLQLRLERRRRDAAERGGAAAETSTAGLARQRHRCWDVLRGAVARTEVERGSAALLRVSAALPPEQLEYGGVAWSASRTYIDEGRRCCEGGSRDGSGGEALAAAFEPLVEGVQNAVRRRFARRVSRFTSHLCVRQRVRVCACGCARVCCRRSATVGASCDWRAPSRLCAGALEDRERSQPLRSGRLRILICAGVRAGGRYAGETRGMAEHRDYDSQGRLVPVSAILQCHTECGFEGGGLWMRRPTADRGSYAGDEIDRAAGSGGSRVEPLAAGPDGRVLVELAVGDILMLQGAWHQPRDIRSGQRLIIVCFFFDALNYER
jgi:hypothetical protein